MAFTRKFLFGRKGCGPVEDSLGCGDGGAVTTQVAVMVDSQESLKGGVHPPPRRLNE